MNKRPVDGLGGSKNLSVVAVAVAAVFGVVNAGAQPKATALTLPRFEVASVRPSIADDRRGAAQPRSWGEVTGRVTLRHIPLKYVLLQVYDLQPDQVSGPTWLDTEFFDILAVAPAGTSKEQVRLMFQALLEERFKLKFHRQTQTTPVYALIVREGGARLKESLPDDTSEVPDADKVRIRGSGEKKTLSGIGTGRFGRFKLTAGGGVAHYEFASMTTKGLAEFLSQGMLDLPVVDETGLRGSYQVPLDRGRSDVRTARSGVPAEPGDADQPSLTAPDPSGVSLRGSLEKLGLGLVRRKVMSEKFVIEHVERTPTQN